GVSRNDRNRLGVGFSGLFIVGEALGALGLLSPLLIDVRQLTEHPVLGAIESTSFGEVFDGRGPVLRLGGFDTRVEGGLQAFVLGLRFLVFLHFLLELGLGLGNRFLFRFG